VFYWGPEQLQAIVTLKTAIIIAPALIQINYSPGAGEIILMVDLSGARWGATLN